jgi:hypothetical protein
MIFSDNWLKNYYKFWSDNDLQDRYREITLFGGNETEAVMLRMELDRRAKEAKGA